MQDRADEGNEAAQKRLESYPVLEPDLQAVFADYQILSRTRQQGFDGPGRLQLVDVLALHAAKEWGDALPEDEYIEVMLALDAVEVEFYNSRRPANKSGR